MNLPRLPPLRGAQELPQLAVPVPDPGLPAGAVPPDRVGKPARAVRRRRVPGVLHDRHGRAGRDGRGRLGLPRSSRPNGRVGWTRQMRITPLPVRTYFRTKVVVGYLRALLTLVLLALAGTALGVRLPAQGWLTVLGLFLVGLIPFAVLGILLGHLIGADAAGSGRGRDRDAVRPTGRRVRLRGGHVGPGLRSSSRRCPRTGWCRPGRPRWAAHGWPVEGWIVIAAWTVVLVPLAVRVYRRDTSRRLTRRRDHARH